MVVVVVVVWVDLYDHSNGFTGLHCLGHEKGEDNVLVSWRWGLW